MMSAGSANQGRRALVLSGGGGRGAYHVGVLEYLQDVGWWPDVVVGTSVGAVNAAALGSGVSVRGLRSRWLDLTTADVQKMRADDVFIDNLLRRQDHIFDLDPLLSTLQGKSEKWALRPWYNAEVLNGRKRLYDVHVTSVNARSGRLVYFSNCDRAGLRVEHVVASFSIPLWYLPTPVDGEPYWDGGVIENTPFRKALELGAAEIVVVMMTPWPERPFRALTAPDFVTDINDELLMIPQRLWNAFEPALDAMLIEIFWRDWRLYELQRQGGAYPHLRWLRIVAPKEPLTTGLMTHYQREYHELLFSQGYQDAREDLNDVLHLPRPLPR